MGNLGRGTPPTNQRSLVSGSAATDRACRGNVASYVTSAPKLAAWIEENIPQDLAVLAFPKTHQQRLRTTNPLERIDQELKRRTRVARVLLNEASLLRLVSALLAEIDVTSQN